MYKTIRTLVIDGKKEKVEVTEKNRRVLDRLIQANSIQDLGTEILFDGPICIKCLGPKGERLLRKDEKGSVVDKGFICPKCGSIVWGIEF